MSKKFNKLFFSTLKRTARMQRQALKRISAPATKRARKASKAAAPRPTIVTARPETVVAVKSGKGKWGNHVHQGESSLTMLAPRLPYSLYRPPAKSVAGLPLVIMLHGCQQLPYELAEGTRMNELADQKGFVVAYPRQAKTSQVMRCWHWFQPDARYGLAEADIIADLARRIVRKYRLNPARIYVAGLSAGAGMAGLIALRHPDLFAAVAMHSGAVLGSAHNAASGLRAMRQGSDSDPLENITPLVSSARPFSGIPAMILHGKRDGVVSARNAAQLARQFSYLNRVSDVKEQVLGQHTHRQYLRHDYVRNGQVRVRLCVMDEVGHAWSGGDSTHKFHSEKGPRASVLIWQFFSRHHHGSEKR